MTNQISQIRTEFAKDLVERMTDEQRKSYLVQILYSDVSHLSLADVRKRYIDEFGLERFEKQFDSLSI